MKVPTILDHIDSGHMALPEFQRGYVWNSDQVRRLFTSPYLRRPVDGLLVWATESRTAGHRGNRPLAAGVVKLLLDGQQRMTWHFGAVRGNAVLLNKGAEIIAIASQAGYRCFTEIAECQRYVQAQILAEEAPG